MQKKSSSRKKALPANFRIPKEEKGHVWVSASPVR